MRLNETPPAPTYPEYQELLAEAVGAARGFLDPRSIYVKQALIARRSDNWCLAVLGRPCYGLGHISSVEAELLVLADAAGIDPPLPQWVIEGRAETARREAAEQERRAKLRQRDEEAWKAAREQCTVEVEVRQNTTARVRGRGGRENLGHAVPLVDAMSGRSRQHRAGRALCETSNRARPLALGEPVDAPATCVRCLAYAVAVRPVVAGV